MNRHLKILIDELIDKIILLRSLKYDISFKYNKKQGGMLCVYDSGKVVWIYPYISTPTKSYARKILTDYFGNSIIRN